MTLHSSAGSAWFADHSIFRLPCDPSDARVRRTHAGQCDIIHRFVLRDAVVKPLNLELAKLALIAEQSRDATDPQKSNIGGFQSKADLFCSRADAEADRSFACARTLRGALDAALQELRGVAPPLAPPPATKAPPATSSSPVAAAAATAAPLAEQTAWLNKHRAAHADMMRAHGGVAWLNVNREGHANKLHIHDPTRLSAVYFVAGGGGSSSSEQRKDASPTDGHLVLRGGNRDDSENAAPTTHRYSYIAAAPEPGHLWLFSGAVPHCVLPFGGRAGISSTSSRQHEIKPRRSPLAPRISVAINLVEDAPAPR